MEQDEFDQLLERYRNGEATPEEADFIDAYYKAFALRADADNQPDEFWKEIKAEIDARIDQQQPSKVTRLWPRIAAAASIVLALSFGGYYILHKTQPQQTAYQKNDFAPGGNKAILTLAGGQKIILNNARNGLLAQQGNTAITKTADGKVVYQAAANGKAEAQYNTLSTQRGGQYQLVLPDGSKVWLNSVSSITYPTSFTGKERKVAITGEAYFEVVNNKAKPFMVTVNGQTVQDLGTHFDINAYPEEGPIRTTLLEGSVKVAANDQAVILKPGQQSQVSKANVKITVIQNADTEQAIAWKDGFFELNDADIQTIMRQAARWYDVDIAYEGKIPQRQLSGKIRRSENASKLLEMLSYFNVHFEVQGRKIIVKQ